MLIWWSSSSRLRLAFRFLVAPYTMTQNSPIVPAFAALSDSTLGSSALIANLVLGMNRASVVSASYSVFLVRLLRPSPFIVVHNFDDQEYKRAVNMKRTQQEKETWLVSDLLVELKNARVHSWLPIPRLKAKTQVLLRLTREQRSSMKGSLELMLRPVQLLPIDRMTTSFV